VARAPFDFVEVARVLHRFHGPVLLPPGRWYQLGAVIRAAREAGKSNAIVRGVRNPLKKFFEHMVETKGLSVSPAAELRYFAATSTAERSGAPVPLGRGVLLSCALCRTMMLPGARRRRAHERGD